MSVKKNILDKIEKEDIKPISKSIFLFKKNITIIIFIILVIIGVLLTSFFLQDFWENYHMIWYGLFYVPLLWVLVICILWLIAYFESKNSWKLYKYQFSVIFGILIFVFVSLGWFFNLIGFWWVMNEYMQWHMWFDRFSMRQQVWSDFTNWRWAWTIKELSWDKIVLQDLNNKEWEISTKNSEIFNELWIWDKVRFLWKYISTWKFEATEILPWFWQWMMRWKGFWWGWWMMNWIR